LKKGPLRPPKNFYTTRKRPSSVTKSERGAFVFLLGTYPFVGRVSYNVVSRNAHGINHGFTLENFTQGKFSVVGKFSYSVVSRNAHVINHGFTLENFTQGKFSVVGKFPYNVVSRNAHGINHGFTLENFTQGKFSVVGKFSYNVVSRNAHVNHRRRRAPGRYARGCLLPLPRGWRQGQYCYLAGYSRTDRGTCRSNRSQPDSPSRILGRP